MLEFLLALVLFSSPIILLVLCYFIRALIIPVIFVVGTVVIVAVAVAQGPPPTPEQREARDNPRWIVVEDKRFFPTRGGALSGRGDLYEVRYCVDAEKTDCQWKNVTSLQYDRAQIGRALQLR